MVHAERRRPVSPSRAGSAWEARAERHLAAHGLTLVARNHRCRGGEIDLVMQDGDSLVFVEVRYRRSARHGSALESIDARKQRRLILAAEDFLSRHPQHAARPCRFDVVAVHGPGAAPRCDWIAGAFSA